MSKPRVLIAGFKHETNTFSALKTDIEDFRARAYHVGEAIRDVYASTPTEIAAFFDACERYGWEAIPAVVADATPSGVVTRDTYEEIAGHIISTIESAGRLDAVLLQLHGAMVAEHALDGEGELLARIREFVGRSIPIGVTLDMHANITDAMAHYADVVVSYRTYPHVDHYDIAIECAVLVANAMAGEIKPKVSVFRPAMLTAFDEGRTQSDGPMRQALRLADEFRTQPGVLSVSVNAGFPWADTPATGPSILFVTEGDCVHAKALAQQLLDLAWATRDIQLACPIHAAEAVCAAKAIGRKGAPAIIADPADNPGAGGYGDGTAVLHEMVQARLGNAAVSAIFDPDSVNSCFAAGLNARLSLDIGGKIGREMPQPLILDVEVIGLYDGRIRMEGPIGAATQIDLGPASVVRAGGIDIVLTSRRFQNYDLAFFKAFGIDPLQKAVLAVKSSQHFRAAYEHIASAVFITDEPAGIATRDFKRLPYRHVRRPIWPLDMD